GVGAELGGHHDRLVEALPGGEAALGITRADDRVRHRDDRDGLLAALLRAGAVDVAALLPDEIHIRHHRHGSCNPLLCDEQPGLSLRPFARWQRVRPSESWGWPLEL